MYWGSFGRLKGVELERDMLTPKGDPIDVRTLNGFFEAPWLFKRNGTWYMAYAAMRHGVIMRRVTERAVLFGEAIRPEDPDAMIIHRKTLQQMLDGSYWERVSAP